MARPELVTTELEQEITRAGDAVMLLIARSVWEVLQKQAAAEGGEPGAVLSKALAEYVERRGGEDARQYLATLKERVGCAT